MSYVVPSVLVYQQLAQSGGVANATPDLKGCIIGPCYNVLSYVAGSTASLIQTAATAAASAQGSMVTGSPVVTFTIQPPFAVGDTLLVPGAGTAGATLSGKVILIQGYDVTLDVNAVADVANVVVNKTAVITDNSVTNTFYLPSQKPGQNVDIDSIQVYLNNARVETLATRFTGVSGQSVLSMEDATSAAVATSASDELTGVVDAYKFTIGDPVSVSGAGAAGADLVTTITNIVGTTVSIASEAGTTNATATLTKLKITNVNPNTATLRLEAGDEIELFYQDAAGDDKVFTSSVLSVVNLTGNIESVNIADMLPADLSATTTLSAAAAAAATSLTVTSATGFEVGDQLVLEGAGAGGSDLYTKILTISTNTLTVDTAVATAVQIGAKVTRVASLTLRSRKLYNNQLLQKTVGAYANYNTSSTGTTGGVTINPAPKLAYGTVITAAVNMAYKALRLDLSGAVQAIANPNDIVGTLGTPSDENPLALGVQIAMANTTGEISCIAVQSDDMIGYQAALDLAEGEVLYALAPLTQDQAILTIFKNHVEQMSTPEMASWRMAFLNSEVPLTKNIGPWSESLVNSNGGNNTISIIAGKYVLTASNATFISDGVVPGDIIHITSGTGNVVGTAQVQNVVNNQQVVIQTNNTGTNVSYYVTRALTKAQQADAVAAQSTTYGSNRVVNVMPDLCGINVNGAVKPLPGYYLSCAAVGLVSGLPVQQGLTNIAVAGISTLYHSNFYFTRPQMDKMAGAGTFLYVQETQNSTPYIRHELTTDMTVLQYREIQQVKNIDFLSYYFVQILKGFIGRWNITPDSLNTLRQTISAGAGMLQGKKLPKIGPPLLSLKIVSIAQNALNKDNVDCHLVAEIGVPMNYINVYLTV